MSHDRRNLKTLPWKPADLPLFARAPGGQLALFGLFNECDSKYLIVVSVQPIMKFVGTIFLLSRQPGKYTYNPPWLAPNGRCNTDGT